MEADQVDAAFDAVQQARQFADVARGVVQPAHHDVFERHPPLVGEVVFAQDRGDFGDRPRPFDGHDLHTLFVEGVVEADGQVNLRRVEKTPQFGHDARRGERDACRRPAETPLGGDYLERPQHLVRVVERFAHAHEHEVREFVALGQRNRLVEDFGRRERLLKPLPPRGAEAAAHAASGLRRDAERGPLPVGDVGRLDVMPFERAEQVFLRAVGRLGDALRGAQRRREPFGEPLAVRGGDVGHPQRVFRVADVEPAGDLPRGEARHSQLAAKGCELVGRFAV